MSTIKLVNREGESIDVAGLTHELASAIAPALSDDWWFTHKVIREVDEPIGITQEEIEAAPVPPPPKKARTPKEPKPIDDSTASLVMIQFHEGTDGLTKGKIRELTGLPVDVVSNAVDRLVFVGQLTLTGKTYRRAVMVTA